MNVDRHAVWLDGQFHNEQITEHKAIKPEFTKIVVSVPANCTFEIVYGDVSDGDDHAVSQKLRSRTGTCSWLVGQITGASRYGDSWPYSDVGTMLTKLCQNVQ